MDMSDPQSVRYLYGKHRLWETCQQSQQCSACKRPPTLHVKDRVQGFLVSRSMTPQWMSGSNSLSDNLLFKNFRLLEVSSDFFSRAGDARSPLPLRICPGEGKVGFGIEGQLRPGLTEELTVAGQAGPTAGFSSVPSIFG